VSPVDSFLRAYLIWASFVPHDFASLISLLGGPDAFVERLNYFYASGLQDISNEPSFLSVYAYHYAGRPGLSAQRVHSFITADFNTSESGLPGNDDSGAMASFTALSMMGTFPNAGQNVYLIVPPFFESISITNPSTGNTATISVVQGFDPTYKAIFIQSATLNGQNYTKNWIGHEFFLRGGKLELVLGTQESSWGTAVEDLPPSLSTMQDM